MEARAGTLAGVLAMAVVWAFGWALPGGVIEAIDNLAPAAHGFTRKVDMWPQTLGLPGLVGGLIFSLLLVVTDARRRFAELSVGRSAAWGAAAGLVTGGVVVWLLYTGLSRSWQSAATGIAVAVLLGLASGAASPLLFRFIGRGMPSFTSGRSR